MANGHGGFREGAGRKPWTLEQRAAALARNARRRVERGLPEAANENEQRAKAAAATPARARGSLDARAMLELLRQSMQGSGRGRFARTPNSPFNPFRLPAFPPQATPPVELRMAMDQSIDWANSQWAQNDYYSSFVHEGIQFLGYPYLAELAQRPEYRVISETIADDATRKWIDFNIVGDADDAERARKDPAGEAKRLADPDERRKRLERRGKMDKAKELRDDQARLEVRDRIYQVIRDDGFFGRSHVYVDLGVEVDGDARELATSIGDGTGRDDVSRAKVRKGSLRALRVVEPVWVYPTTYNALNPLDPTFYQPQVWYVLGKQIHVSRLPKFVGHEVPDLLKPSYAFGGAALSQLAKPYIDIWLKTRQSVGDLIHAFSVMVLKTDLNTLLGLDQGSAGLIARADAFNAGRDNAGLFLVNKNTEDFANVSTPLGGLHELQAQAQEHMMSVVRIPATKFTGMQPSGLSTTSEGEMRAYYDTIAGYQNRVVRPKLTYIVNLEHLSLWGEVDPEVTFDFAPLWEMSEQEMADLHKAEADRDQVYVDMGALAPTEVRKRIVDDPDLPYADLDPEDAPDLREEEMEGLVPEGAGRGLQAIFERPESGNGGPSRGGDVVRMRKPAVDAVDAFDAEWKETEHPRDEDGKFSATGGGGEGAGTSPYEVKAGPFKRKGRGNLKDVGRKPKKRAGGVVMMTDAAEVAWYVAQRDGRPTTMVVTSRGWHFLKPDERVGYGQPHMVVDPDGNVDVYEAKPLEERDAELQGEAVANASSLYRRPTKAVADIVASVPGAREAIDRVRERLAKSIPTDALVKDGGFKREDGTYTPERAAVHRAIMEKIFAEEAVKAAMPLLGAKPTLTVIGGRGGSGKGWFTKEGGPVDVRSAILLDSDAIKVMLPGYEGWNASLYHEEATDLLAVADRMATALGVNVVHDATIKSEANTAVRMARHEKAGYEVVGYYMYASPDVAAERALKRFAKGGKFEGRFVPPEVILEKNVDNERNFDKLSNGMKRWAIYDNDTAEGPRLVSESRG